MEHRGHVHHVEGNTVDAPTVEPIIGGIVFGKEHIDNLIGLGHRLVIVTEDAIIPGIGFGGDPLRFAFVVRIFHDDTHAVAAVIVGEVAHDPYAGVVHLHDGAYPFGGSDPEQGYFRRARHRVTVEGDDFKGVAGKRETADLGSATIED